MKDSVVSQILPTISSGCRILHINETKKMVSHHIRCAYVVWLHLKKVLKYGIMSGWNLPLQKEFLIIPLSIWRL